jgi:6-phosphogluconolactonase
MPRVHLVDDVPTAFAALVRELGPASIALSGGSTARGCYEAAAACDGDWSATSFWFGDERWVPVTDPESNEGMARSVWLDHGPTAGVHSLVEAGPDPETAARNYEAHLRTAPPLGLVHLGLGPDGHTASLFPGSTALGETERWVVATGDDVHPHPRLTITFSALAVVETILVTVAGAEKRSAYRGVMDGDPELPASRLVTASELAERTTWLVDPAAAG